VSLNIRLAQDHAEPRRGAVPTEAIDSRRRREEPGEAALTPQLYNNHDDPGHTNNVIAANPGIAADLRDRYIAFLESVDTAEEFVAPRRNATLT
jgi:hypothetical protein